MPTEHCIAITRWCYRPSGFSSLSSSVLLRVQCGPTSCIDTTIDTL
eukprot:XP_001705968.1 Hypothetical protein GL50803_121997 [Giardia lamblia ATCC 50803]